MSFLTKPAWIREETLDLATASAAVEFHLCTIYYTLYFNSFNILYYSAPVPFIYTFYLNSIDFILHCRCSQSGTLKVHMRMHTSEKPYQCTLCPESFVSNSRLKLHMGRAHTSNEDKPFKCTSCGKGFALNYILRAHAKVHSKPHRCMACGRKFAMQSKLKLHLKTCKGPKKKKFFPDSD